MQSYAGIGIIIVCERHCVLVLVLVRVCQVSSANKRSFRPAFVQNISDY